MLETNCGRPPHFFFCSAAGTASVSGNPDSTCASANFWNHPKMQRFGSILTQICIFFSVCITTSDLKCSSSLLWRLNSNQASLSPSLSLFVTSSSRHRPPPTPDRAASHSLVNRWTLRLLTLLLLDKLKHICSRLSLG